MDGWASRLGVMLGMMATHGPELYLSGQVQLSDYPQSRLKPRDGSVPPKRGTPAVKSEGVLGARSGGGLADKRLGCGAVSPNLGVS